MADAPPRSDEPSVNDAGPTSPVASQQTTTPISPLNLSSHRQLHDTYKVITPVNSPKRAPQPTSEVGSPQNAAAAATQKRPNLHLNLSVIKSAPSRPLVPSATGRVKKVTRDIAALDFLQNIPMSSEYYSSASDTNYLNSPVPHDANDAVLSDNEDEHALAGRRLPGPDCQVMRMPPLIRYRMTTKYPPASATVRLWEGNMNEVGLVNSRIFLSSGKGYPVAVTSVIKV
ncbi:hypothetical protein DYB35_010496 [Aphanomyces astaci]|uniref:Uncharacterized protein n=2 Tax=Aphanomyces astaci TaxID=112090 RepID=A0A418CXF6_APHAT|nr:hypothetical protein DYB35_010496 [Aphanomyces astaci]